MEFKKSVSRIKKVSDGCLGLKGLVDEMIKYHINLYITYFYRYPVDVVLLLIESTFGPPLLIP